MIGQGLRSETARVFTEHLPEYHRSVARFIWPEGEPEDYFDVAVNDVLSIRFDAHLPVRPDTITLLGDARGAEEAILGQLSGMVVTQAIIAAEHTGFGTLETALTAENRLALAELQANSPTTPPLIKSLAQAIASRSSSDRPQFAARTEIIQPEYRPIQG